MSHVVSLDKNGHLIYEGMLSSKEIATIDEILEALKKEIPQVENDLLVEYNKSVLYKYYLGKFLAGLLDKYKISFIERRKFWDEIKLFATKENRVRNEGANSVTRSFYEQCYVISQYDIETVEKLSWRQWQDLLDRVGNREDERIFAWIKNSTEKIREDDWREFEKALHLYLKKKDTSVFSDYELFSIYDSIMLMCQTWREKLKEYSELYPKSMKIRHKGVWAKKYYSRCFELKKEQRLKTITKDLCNSTFSIIMN